MSDNKKETVIFDPEILSQNVGNVEMSLDSRELQNNIQELNKEEKKKETENEEEKVLKEENEEVLDQEMEEEQETEGQEEQEIKDCQERRISGKGWNKGEGEGNAIGSQRTG